MSNPKSEWFLAGAMCVFLCVGCDAVDEPFDGGSDPDGAVERDATAPLDAHVDGAIRGDGGLDAPPGDGGFPCVPACDADEACVRGVCVASCGAELAALGDALADGLVPLANVCRTITGPVDVVEQAAGEPSIYDLASATEGNTTTFTLSRWTLNPGASTPVVETVATATHVVAGPTVMTFAGGYLAVDPTEAHALFGYTTTEAGFLGGVLDVAVGDGTANELSAPGNFGAAWLDSSRWVVNGLGLEGVAGDGEQGLYLRDIGDGASTRAVEEMGSASGGVALMGDVVVAGAYAGFGSTWPDTTEGGRVFVIDRAELLAAVAPLSAWDDSLARFEAPNSFEPLSGMRLASTRYDDAFAIAALETRALSRSSAGAWSIAAPVALTIGSAFTAVYDAGDGRLLLVHADGVLLVEE